MFNPSARVHARQQVDAHAPERNAVADGPGGLLLTVRTTKVSGACKLQAVHLLPLGASVDDLQGNLDGFAHLAIDVVLARGVGPRREHDRTERRLGPVPQFGVIDRRLGRTRS